MLNEGKKPSNPFCIHVVICVVPSVVFPWIATSPFCKLYIKKNAPRSCVSSECDVPSFNVKYSFAASYAVCADAVAETATKQRKRSRILHLFFIRCAPLLLFFTPMNTSGSNRNSFYHLACFALNGSGIPYELLWCSLSPPFKTVVRMKRMELTTFYNTQ